MAARRLRIALALIAGAALAVPAALLGEVAWYAHARDPGPADAAIVLGAAVYRDVPSPVFEERIRHAVRLYQDRIVGRLVMTGGLSPGDRLTEAEAARNWSTGRGVPDDAVLLEDRSRTTEQNLAFALPILQRAGLSRVLIESDPLHMRRALALARRLALDAHPSPTPTSRYVGWRPWTGFLLREGYFLARCRIAGRC